MFFKTVLAFSVLLVVTSMANPVQSRSTPPLQLVSVIEIQEPCVRQGGVCLRIEDCKPGNLVQIRGVLCPEQKHLGVECCYL